MILPIYSNRIASARPRLFVRAFYLTDAEIYRKSNKKLPISELFD
jgi:hypothetical protein